MFLCGILLIVSCSIRSCFDVVYYVLMFLSIDIDNIIFEMLIVISGVI